MKKSIIEELFHGNIIPEEQGFFKDPDYRHLVGKMDEAKTGIKGGMSREQIEGFEELEGMLAKLSSMENAKSFAYGFKLGVSLIAEALWGVDDSNRSRQQE